MEQRGQLETAAAEQLHAAALEGRRSGEWAAAHSMRHLQPGAQHALTSRYTIQALC